ncbi:MAG TPA: NAD(P)-dependent oxidoreductase [Acidimicrobiales bacterium]|nr:NAD(P)-dependent oxidoreductase [Acidimicrobiales bacterium]
MKALVTGGGGFVGSHLAARLALDGWEVVTAVRPEASPWRLAALGVAGDVTIVPADLVDPATTAAVTREAAPDVAFLLAAARSRATPAERAATAAVNATSGAWLVDALPERCRGVVRLGSSTEYARTPGPMDETTPLRPRGFFGATKAAGSLLVAAAAVERGVRATVLRAFQVYGPLDHPHRLVPRALRAARTGEVLPLTTVGLRRDWVFVSDVVEACVRAALADELPTGQVLNIGTGRQVANDELVDEVRRVTGRPVAVAEGACAPREWDTGSWVCDPSLARQLLGWEAKVALDEGLARCWQAERG